MFFLFLSRGAFLLQIMKRIILITFFIFFDYAISYESNCYFGTYIVQQPPFGSCSGFRVCEKGYYCSNGIKYPCPAGKYGDTEGNTNETCNGLCHAGFYCPIGSKTSTAFYCGGYGRFYCPIGSKQPIIAPDGYYTVDTENSDYELSITYRSNIIICPFGHYCINGIKYQCKDGYYGNEEGLKSENCSGICSEGWYCPVGSTLPFQNPCPKNASFYCPQGSIKPLITAVGYYAIKPHLNDGGGYGSQTACPKGFYCLDGKRFKCSGGRFGAILKQTNSSCSGLCRKGFFFVIIIWLY
jgi:hypothetical protein